MWKLYEGDCLEVMKQLPDNSIDMILADLPYGTTACKWDTIIPFELLWEQYKRLIKPGRAIVLFGSEPFSSYLRMSNIKDYKYDWIWNKGRGFNPQLCNVQPMKSHEIISVFGKGKILYNPQMIPCKPYTMKRKSLNKADGDGQNIFASPPQTKTYNEKHPTTILLGGFERGLHPTQKPVALCEYLIKTYTNEGDTVLDNVAGSGTTGVAALNTGRKVIMIEKEPKYCELIRNRIANR